MFKSGIAVLFLILAHSVTGQREDIQFEHLSMRDGLSMNPVMAITQDQKGFMWFGTQDGLNRYDGYTFKVFKNKEGDKRSLSDNFVTSIFVDQQGIIWIGTLSGGLNKFDYREAGFTTYRPGSSELTADRIWCISGDTENTLWIGTEKGITLLTDKGLTACCKVYPELSVVDNLSVLCIFHDSKKNVWIGTTNGLFVFNPVTTEVTSYANSGFSNNIILSVFEDKNNQMWIGTVDGLNKLLPGGKFKSYFFKERIDKGSSETTPSSVKNIYSIINNYGGNTVRCMLQDIYGYLWIGTDMELIIFDPSSESFINFRKDLINPTGINDHFIRSMYMDKSDIVWIGTMGNGINKTDLKPKKFRHYQKKLNDPNSLSENYVRAMVEGADGKIWIGTLIGGLNLFDPSSEKFYAYLPNGKNDGSAPNDNNVWSLCFENDHILWIGTNNGLNRYDIAAGKFTYYVHDEKKPGSISENTIRSIYVSSTGIIWVGTEGGLNRFNPETNSFTVYTANENDPNALSNNTVWKIIEDQAGVLWLATNNGLNSFNTETEEFTVYQNDPENLSSLSHSSVRTILMDDQERLWVGTQNGLNLFDPETQKFRRFSEEDGLPNPFIYSIEQDNKGFIWFSTNKGLARMDRENFSVRSFDIYDGLQDYEFNTNASCSTRDGEMYFAGPGGLNRFNPRKLKSSGVNPHIEITLIKILDSIYSSERDLSEVSELTLNYDQNNLYFEFTALDFSNPSRNQYSYLMEGFDASWIMAGNRRTATYTNLDPGNYVFKVRGTNADGQWSTFEKHITITILPPFWQTSWFYALCVISTLLLIVLLYKWRVRNLTRDKLILQQKVAERTRDLEEEKLKIESINRELEKLSIVASKTDNSVVIADQDGTIEWINAGYTKLYGSDLDVTKYYGKNIISTSSNKELAGIIQTAVVQKKSMTYESSTDDADGRRFSVQSTLTPIFDDHNQLRKLVIIDTDITERKRNEEIIREKNKDITDSINYALRIQRAILPDDSKISEILPDHFVFYRPKDIVSGDFYFIEKITTNDANKLSGFAVGDCTGHGVPGAFMSIIAHNYLKQSLSEHTVNTPGDALDFVSRKIRDTFATRNDVKAIRDGMDIAFCVLDQNSQKIYYAGANRPLIIISGGELKEIRATPQPVGFSDAPKPFETHSVDVKKGDVVYLFSDGFADQFGGPHGKKFKYSRFKELLLSIHQTDAQNQLAKLNDAFLSWKGELEQLDDICVLGVRI